MDKLTFKLPPPNNTDISLLQIYLTKLYEYSFIKFIQWSLLLVQPLDNFGISCKSFRQWSLFNYILPSKAIQFIFGVVQGLCFGLLFNRAQHIIIKETRS